MRLLPCKSAQCAAKGAMLPPSAAYPNGEPYLSGGYDKSYVCARCGDRNQLSLADYNSLQPVRLKDLDRMAGEFGKQVRTLATADLEGAGLKKRHAEDMFNAGFKSAHDVADLERA